MIDRLVQIGRGGAADFKLLGTGYLVGPGLILTALHVVLGDVPLQGDTVPKVVEPLDVRLYHDLNRDTPENKPQAAHLHWFWWPADPRSPGYDLAVLKLSDDLPKSYNQLPASLIDVGRNDCGQDPRPCKGAGFPTWRAVGKKFLRHGISGRLDLSDFEARPNDFLFTLEETVAPPEDDEWEGLSGAAIHGENDETVLAVVNATRASRQGLSFHTTILPPRRGPAPDRKYDPSGFWAAIGQAASSVPPASIPLRAHARRAEDFVPLIDRSAHDELFRDGFEDRREQNDLRPGLVLYHSRDVDDPSNYPGRYCSGYMEGDPFGDLVQTSVPLLSWPTTAPAKVDKWLVRMKQSLVDFATADLAQSSGAQETLTAGSPVGMFRKYFAHGHLPRVLQISMQPGSMSDPAHTALLGEFLDFYADVANSSDLNCLFIGLAYETTPALLPGGGLQPRDPPLLELARADWAHLVKCAETRGDKLRIWEVGALTEVGSSDVGPWKQRLTRRRNQIELPPDRFFTRLYDALSKDGRLPVAGVRRHVRTIEDEILKEFAMPPKEEVL